MPKKPVTVAPNKARVGFLVLKDPPTYCDFYFDPKHVHYGKYKYECEAFRLTGGNKGIGYFRLNDGYNGWSHGTVPPGMAEQNKNFNFYPDLATAVANLPASMSAADKALFASYQDPAGIPIKPAAPNPPQTDWSKVDLAAIIEEHLATKANYVKLAVKYNLSVLTLRSKVNEVQCSDSWLKLVNEWRHSQEPYYQAEWAKMKNTFQGQLIQKYLP